MRLTKRLLVIPLCILTAGSLVSFVPFVARQEASPIVYEMYVNDNRVGVIRHAAKGLSYYDKAIEEIKEKYPEDVTILSDVYFKEADGSQTAITGEPLIAAAIEKAVDIETPAYAININGNTVCYVRSIDEANRITEAVKAPFINEVQSSGASLEEVRFAEDVRFDPVQIPFDMLVDEGEALSMLQQTTAGTTEYTILEGDTLWTIARANDMHVNDILALNPALDAENIKIGDRIALSAQKKLLTVITTEKSSYQEEIPYNEEIKEDKTLLQGKTQVVQEGKNGKKEIQVYITRKNGIEVSREIIGETVLEQPVTKIIAKGTKKPVTPAPTPKPSAPSGSSPAPVDRGSARGSDIVNFAMQYLGKPYVYAAEGPDSFDCSGFTWFVYKHFGYSIPRGSSSQGSVGKAVAKSDLALGDIVLFTSPNSGGAIGHVGIYIGGGKFIHASSGSERKVIISTLESGSYASRY